MPRNSIDPPRAKSSATPLQLGKAGQSGKPTQSRTDLKLQENGPGDPRLRAAALKLPKSSTDAYRLKIKHHPRRQKQDTVDTLKRQNEPEYLRDALSQMAGNDRRSNADWSFDKWNKSDGVVTYAGRSRSAAGMTGKAPAATHLQRSILLRQKRDVLSQFKTLKRMLSPLSMALVKPGAPKPPDGSPKERENEQDVLGRIGSALSRMKFSVRDLLIIAHAQRDAIVAERDAGNPNPGDTRELDRTIASLEELDEKLHGVADKVASLQAELDENTEERARLLQRNNEIETLLADPDTRHDGEISPIVLRAELDANEQALHANKTRQRELPAKMLKELGVQDGTPELAELPPASNVDPRTLYDGMDAVTNNLEAAWTDEPAFLSELWRQGARPPAGMEEDQRYDAITDVLDTLRLANAIARQSSGITQAEKPGLLARFPGRDINRPMDAMFAAAEQRRVAADFEAAARGQLEANVLKLDAALRKGRVPGIEPNADQGFQADMVALKSLASQVTVRRHLDDISAKNREIETEVGRELKMIERLDGNLKTSKFDTATRTDVERDLSARKDRVLRLKNQLRALPNERAALAGAAKSAGINVDRLPSLDKLTVDFETQRQRVENKMNTALDNYSKGWFARKRKRQARDLAQQMSKVATFGGGGSAAKMRKPIAIAGNGTGYRLTFAEVNATLADWLTERKQLDYVKGRNLGLFQTIGRAFSKLGRLLKTGSKGVAAAKSAAGSTDRVQNVRHRLLVPVGDEREKVGIAKIAESGLGTVLAGVEVYNARTTIKGKEEKAATGKEYVAHYRQTQLDIHDPETKARAKYASRVTLYLGQALQRQEFGAGTGSLIASGGSGAHYITESVLPIVKQYTTVPTLAAQSAAASSVGVHAMAYVAHAVVAAYKTGKGVVDRKTIEKAARDHRNDFAESAGKAGINLSLDITKPADTKAIRAKIANANNLDQGVRTRLNHELDSLAESEALVDMLKGHTDVANKALKTAYKGLAGVGYGMKVFVPITVAAGGLATAGTVVIGAAAVVAGGYYGYKTYKGAKQDYQARRATHAVMGLADKAVIDKLTKSASRRDISGDQMAINLIAAKDPTVAAQKLLGKLRSESAGAIDPAKSERRVKLEIMLADIDASIANCDKQIAGASLDVDADPAKLDPKDPRVTRSNLLSDKEVAQSELKRANEEMAQAVLDASRTARTLHVAQKMPGAVVLALVEADPSLDDQSVGLITESILKRK